MTMPVNEFIRARDILIKYRTDYERAYQEFTWPRMRYFNWALDHFDVIAKDNHKVALWLVNERGDETRLSFAQLAARSNQVANFLLSLGVRRGDVILIMLGNEVPLWETILAGMKIGAVLVPTTTLLSANDLVDRILRSNAKYFVVSASETAKFTNLAAEATRICVGEPQDGWINFEQAYQASEELVIEQPTETSEPLLLYFTSGTTEKPKLVVHTHQSYPVGHLSTMYWLGLQQDDIHWNISSPGWGKHSWSSFFAPWNIGATIFIYKYARFNAKEILSMLVRYGITTMCAPPTVWRMLIQENIANYPVKIRELCSAGEPLNSLIIDQIQKAWGIMIRDGYGQTETTAQLGNSPGQRVKPGSVGRPLPGYKIALLNADDQVAQEGEIGIELTENHRPVGLMAGYKDCGIERTKDAMRNNYYHTSDMAKLDEEGYYTYVGRADDLFKVSDYLISPFELENILALHEAILEAVVVPSPDPIRLAIPKALIVVKAGYQPDAKLAKSIFKHVRQHVSPYRRIRCLEFKESLPKTVSGKVQRNVLKEQERAMRSEQVTIALEFWEA